MIHFTKPLQEQRVADLGEVETRNILVCAFRILSWSLISIFLCVSALSLSLASLGWLKFGPWVEKDQFPASFRNIPRKGIVNLKLAHNYPNIRSEN